MSHGAAVWNFLLFLHSFLTIHPVYRDIRAKYKYMREHECYRRMHILVCVLNQIFLRLALRTLHVLSFWNFLLYIYIYIAREESSATSMREYTRLCGSIIYHLSCIPRERKSAKFLRESREASRSRYESDNYSRSRRITISWYKEMRAMIKR